MMNRGVLQSSPVQQMMAAGNPNWWSMNSFMRPQQPTLVSPSSFSNFMPPPNSLPNSHDNNSNNSDGCVQVHHEYNMMNMSNSCVNSSSSPWINNIEDKHAQDHQQFPHESFSQLLFGGVFTGEEQIMLQQPTFIDHTKQESSVDSYNNNNRHQESRLVVPIKANWSNYPQMNLIPVSSPQSCVTTFSSSNNNNNNNNNVVDFSSSKSSDNNLRARHPDRSSECNSTATGGALKKAKVQASSSQSTFKVRKEKLGDRITAIHQLVSPFGKTDTASVLLEAIGYIRFLHNQVQALSIPYLNSGAGNQRQPHSVQGERNSKFPEDPGQLLNENCLKRKGHPDQESYEEPQDLRSRGLCLVPVACTLHVGNDNGADYWAPALGGGFR